MTILVTGASGFVGSALVRLASKRGMTLRPSFRDAASAIRSGFDPGMCALVGEIGSGTDWSDALVEVDTVIHCAARTTIAQRGLGRVDPRMQEVNIAGTINLARQASSMGVRRFVFVSSIKVNGEATFRGVPFTAEDDPAPVDAYGVSKADAEAGLFKLSREGRMELVVVRPPMVYGPGMSGNLRDLGKWLVRGLPLPLGAIRGNARSIVAVDNLADLLLLCVRHPNAAGQVFLVSDGVDLSTAGLVESLAAGMGTRARLISVSPAFLNICAVLIGKQSAAQRLLESLQVDISKTSLMLGWRPPVSTADAFAVLGKEGMDATHS